MGDLQTAIEALGRAKRQLAYPVDTTIHPRGFNFRIDNDTLEFVHDEIVRALRALKETSSE